MSLSIEQQLFSHDVIKLLQEIEAQGYSFTFGDAFRSPEQAELNAAKGIGIKDSQHCKRLAIDLNLFKDGTFLPDSHDHIPFGKFWCSLDHMNEWGGNFKRIDGNHYERRSVK
jgi:hypothetical protein